MLSDCSTLNVCDSAPRRKDYPFPGRLNADQWVDILTTKTLREWKRKPIYARHHIGALRFGKYRRIALENCSRIRANYERESDRWLRAVLNHRALEAKAALSDMAQEAIFRVCGDSNADQQQEWILMRTRCGTLSPIYERGELVGWKKNE